MAQPLPDFNDEFASAAAWAAMYRACGLQVMPAYYPGEQPKGTAYKRPLLPQWRQFQMQLVPQATFDRWYAEVGGQFADRRNMGIITGECSGRVMVIDLDIHKHPAAREWWHVLLEQENNGIELQTVEQITGGGGRQKLFRYPEGWPAPTNRTAIGVDVRGQGGFAMMAPSRHDSGNEYAWAAGCAPWETEILDAPGWLLDAVEALCQAHGGSDPAGPRTHTASPEADYDGWGHRTDGRETYMVKVVWAAVLDHWRDTAGVLPPLEEQQARAREAYEVYERAVVSRLFGPEKTAALEQEGRGPSTFVRKWRAAMRHWSDKVAEEAAKPRPDRPGGHQDPPGGAGYTHNWGDEFGEGENPGVNSGGSRPSGDERKAADEKPDAAQRSPYVPGAEFLARFASPAYLVDGLIQQSYLYALTARTGHGKTAVSLNLAQAVARGVPFHGRRTKQGSVLFLAGENPDDIRARVLALGTLDGFAPDSLPLWFVDGVINIYSRLQELRDGAAAIPTLALVIVDTAAAYYLGADHNSNAEQAAYARLLRELTKLPGKPAVVVNCHPIKNATADNLVPLGGSAFVNEVDGNLTLWADDKTCTLGPHPEKWRGASFEAIAFELRTVVNDRVKDAEGRHMPCVIAVPITDAGAERQEQVAEENEKVVMRLIHADRRASITLIAKRAGWLNAGGQPIKAKVQRIIDKLRGEKMVTRKWRRLYLTKAGCQAVDLPWREDDE